jgi:hypothetical protein
MAFYPITLPSTTGFRLGIDDNRQLYILSGNMLKYEQVNTRNFICK